MNIFKRIFSDTPKFFKNVRNIGLGLVAAGTAIVTLPIALPAVIVAAAGYIITAGTVAAAVSQAVYKEPDTYPLNSK